MATHMRNLQNTRTSKPARRLKNAHHNSDKENDNASSIALTTQLLKNTNRKRPVGASLEQPSTTRRKMSSQGKRVHSSS